MSTKLFQVGEEVMYRVDSYRKDWHKLPVLRIEGRSYVLSYKFHPLCEPREIKISFQKAHGESLCLSEADQVEFIKREAKEEADLKYRREWIPKVIHHLNYTVYSKIDRDLLEQIVFLLGLHPKTAPVTEPQTSVEAKTS